MRNLAEYPITKEEILNYIQHLEEKISHEIELDPSNYPVGSLDSSILFELKGLVHKHYNV